MVFRTTLLLAATHFGCACAVSAGDEPARPMRFRDAKTLFQTNVAYDPRIAIAVDGVIVHQHGADLESLRGAISSWRNHGYTVGRMFFADSDATNEYWTGKWDGTPHTQDVERDEAGEVVKCAGIRPYMLPTEGWIRYLEEMTARSVDAGADAVLPEEPLAHVFTGYEESFRELWRKRYGRPWEAQSASPEARFLTAQLKNELYIQLERRLLAATRAHARRVNRDLAFVLPVHSLYSNVAAQLVAPLGTSAAIGDFDGYIGQVWTGPVNWALANYDSPDKSFFVSAYALYDYFVQLVAGSDKRLWLLGDPVEDDPNHKWSEFEVWYRHCVVAKLLFPEVDGFEVMPWPDRIFLPGYSTGGGTPAPENYRIVILSAIQALQEVPKGGQRLPASAPAAAGPAPPGVGVAVADTVLWEKEPAPPLQGIYGLLFPLVQAGVPASACLMERMGEPEYAARFRTIVLSFETFKPLEARTNLALVEWVMRGGSLVLLGAADDLDGASLWWKDLGQPSPLHHLAAALGIDPKAEGDFAMGKGWVLRRADSPRRFADPSAARTAYLPLVDLALRKAGQAGGLATPGHFCLRRGPFVVGAAIRTPLALPGKLVNVFHPELPVVDGVRLEPGESGLYRDVTDILSGGTGDQTSPRVLHATHRLMSDRFKNGVSRIVVRGPSETPAVLRVFAAGREPQTVTARDASGQALEATVRRDGPTLLVRFPNHHDGVTLAIRWNDGPENG